METKDRLKRIHILAFAALSLAAIPEHHAYAQILRGGVVETALTVQSPEVAAMSAYTDRPVTLFNGTVPVSIPLCDVTADGYTLPITLTYSTSGFRPSQDATWVGLGWSLSLNASISRCIKCVDDFLEYNFSSAKRGFFDIEQGYYGSAGVLTGDMTRRGLVWKCPVHAFPCADDIYATDLVVDSEPDIFSVSLWNLSDKFVLNDDSSSTVKAIFMDRPAGNVLRILETGEKGRTVHYFELVTNDGTVYEFKKRERSSTRGFQDQSGDSHYHDFDGGPGWNVSASAWLLTRITMPSGRGITFSYADEVYDAVSVETCMKFRPMYDRAQYNLYSELVLPTQSGTVQFYEKDAVYSTSKTVVRTARLTEIKWDSGAARITFSASEREDMYKGTSYNPPPRKLDAITVYDASGKTVHSYRLSYGYFGGNSSGDEAYLYKRLRLDSVEDLLTPGRIYSFEYDESLSFPSKMTHSLDYWGYWNGKNYGSKYYCQVYEPNSKTLYDGADKSSSFAHTRLGTLTAVIHPTGGRETFEYELNRFPWPKYVQDGGRHLQTLYMESTNYTNQSPNEWSGTFSYDYETSITLEGRYERRNGADGWSDTLVSIRDTNTGRTVWCYGGKVETDNSYISYCTIPTQSVTLPAGSYIIRAHRPYREGWKSSWNVSIDESGPVTYRCETLDTGGAGLRIKRITGGGKTREFSYSDGELLVDPIFGQTKTFSSYTLETDPFSQNISAIHPYSINCLLQYSESVIPQSTVAKGYLLGYSGVSERVSDGSRTIVTDCHFKLAKEPRRSPNPSQSTMPNFENGLLQSRIVRENGNIVSSEEYLYDNGVTGYIRAYDFSQVTGLSSIPGYRFQWWLPILNSVTGDGVTTLTRYGYNSRWQLSEKSTVCRNGLQNIGAAESSKYYYTYDSDETVCREMAHKNIMVPVRELIYSGGKLSGGGKVVYRKENGRFLPDASFDIRLDASDLEDDGSYRVRTTYDRYDEKGNPVQVTRDGITSLYIWGYSGQYPIAEITGSMNYGRLENSVGASELKNMRDAKAPNDAQYSKLENLRKSLPSTAPGTLMTVRRFLPLVGVSSVTAPNGLITQYGYDKAGRLTGVSRAGGGSVQPVERYSYSLAGGGQ